MNKTKQTSDNKIFEADRVSGFRPVLVACILRAKKILFVFKRDYNLWQLPQGGIEPFETVKSAAKREIAEELGSFAENINYESLEIIGSDTVEFPKENQGTRELVTSGGEKVHMKGKKYYFAKLRSFDFDIPIEESEFEKYRWVSFLDSDNLVRHIYQKGKKRITEKVLTLLKEKNEI